MDDCFNAYDTIFQSSRGTLILVGETTNVSAESDLYGDNQASGGGIEDSLGWMCSQINRDADKRPCDEILPQIKDNWTPFNGTFQRCVSLKTQEHCKLFFSSFLCWTVTIFNLLKGVLMLLVAISRGEKPILTIGDAVSSFLQRPDPHTAGMCLKSNVDFKKSDWDSAPTEYEATRVRKFRAASLVTAIICVLLYVENQRKEIIMRIN